MAKPHIRRSVAFDAGWTYVKWQCSDGRDIGFGLTARQAYRNWMIQRHYGQAGAPRP